MKFVKPQNPHIFNPDTDQLPPKLEQMPGVQGTRWEVTEPLPDHGHGSRELVEGATTDSCKNNPGKEVINDDYDWQLTDCFISRIAEEVTLGCQLPFSVPKTRIPQIVERVAKYWFAHCDYASEERWFVIRNQDLVGRQNKRIKLPSQIISISDLQLLNSSSEISLRKANFLLERLLTNSVSFYTSFTNNVSFNYAGPTGIQSTDYTNDVFAGMYEIGTLNSILKRTVTFSFNPMTHVLNVLGDNEGCDLVLLTFTRVPLYSLFNDAEFLNHVVGECMIELQFILSSFDFQMPGGVRINYGNYQSRGNELVQAAKQYIEDNQSGDVFIIDTQTS